ncbi:transporter [Pseudomonas sp. App30]|uniref:SphA family protein n=1 Tax=Pseudomonas sp. App30 TaxID=3068990 RepID=UPI003A802DB2
MNIKHTVLSSLLAFSAYCGQTPAADGPPPPGVSQPSGINLGGTSFYDGFAGLPGYSYQSYLRYSSASSIRGNSGQKVSAFDDPKISAVQWLNQVTYYSPESIGGGAHLGWSLLLPVVALDGTFGSNGASLKDNATGLGDITAGPLIQFDPIVDAHGRPVFVQRVSMDFILPTGKYDEHKDINASSHFFSANPYWAATWMPAPRWEMSWRWYYLYNFKNNDPASSTAQFYQGRAVEDTQAGQATWVNFTASYEFFPNVSAGLNGYYFRQLTDDKVNGSRLEDSREKVLGLGPGLFWKIRPGDGLWFNVYQESGVENRAKNDLLIQLRVAFHL